MKRRRGGALLEQPPLLGRRRALRLLHQRAHALQRRLLALRLPLPLGRLRCPPHLCRLLGVILPLPLRFRPRKRRLPARSPAATALATGCGRHPIFPCCRRLTACPHDYCWHSWKNATQIPSNNRATHPPTSKPLSAGGRPPAAWGTAGSSARGCCRRCRRNPGEGHRPCSARSSCAGSPQSSAQPWRCKLLVRGFEGAGSAGKVETHTPQMLQT